MRTMLDTKKTSADRLEQKFLVLLEMDRNDERFLELFAEVHQAIDAEMALEEE